jgi:hypothetical protein
MRALPRNFALWRVEAKIGATLSISNIDEPGCALRICQSIETAVKQCAFNATTVCDPSEERIVREQIHPRRRGVWSENDALPAVIGESIIVLRVAIVFLLLRSILKAVGVVFSSPGSRGARQATDGGASQRNPPDKFSSPDFVAHRYSS